MASNLNYKQVTNVTRRTWDTETYEKRAQARQQELEQQNSVASSSSKKTDGAAAAAAAIPLAGDEKEEFRPAAAGSIGPEGSKRAFLKARSGKVSDIDSRIGTTEMVSAEAAARTKALDDSSASSMDKSQGAVVKTGIGWHCKVCDCFLKDSHTYLDHINGRKHQSKLGYSMRVERSTKQDLAAKLSALVQKKEEQQDAKKSSSTIAGMAGDDDGDESNYYNNMVKAKDDELERRKEERRRKRQERKNKATTPPPLPPPEPPKEEEEQGEEEEEAEEETPEMDPAMAAMMGFSGFGGGKKNR
jgi:U4/U6.U5 tri-snRNP component SNU23